MCNNYARNVKTWSDGDAVTMDSWLLVDLHRTTFSESSAPSMSHQQHPTSKERCSKSHTTFCCLIYGIYQFPSSMSGLQLPWTQLKQPCIVEMFPLFLLILTGEISHTILRVKHLLSSTLFERGQTGQFVHFSQRHFLMPTKAGQPVEPLLSWSTNWLQKLSDANTHHQHTKHQCRDFLLPVSVPTCPDIILMGIIFK